MSGAVELILLVRFCRLWFIRFMHSKAWHEPGYVNYANKIKGIWLMRIEYSNSGA